MNRTVLRVIVLGCVAMLAFGFAGCRKKQPGLDGTLGPDEVGPSAVNVPIEEFGPDANQAVYKAIHFDFDRYDIKQEDIPTLQAIAEDLKAQGSKLLLIEGHCDERGTNEYNLGLGERRSLAAQRFLVDLGVDAMRIKTISYGEEQPVDPGHEESAWWQNRRCEFKTATPGAEAPATTE